MTSATSWLWSIQLRKRNIMEIFDFSDSEYSNRNGAYGGSAGDKDGIIIDGEAWIAKYPKSADSETAGGRPGEKQCQCPGTIYNWWRASSELPLDSCFDGSGNLCDQVKFLNNAIIRNADLVENKLNAIIDFVKSIPSNYNGYEIISESRREYYLKSFVTRFEDVLKKRKTALLKWKKGKVSLDYIILSASTMTRKPRDTSAGLSG